MTHAASPTRFELFLRAVVECDAASELLDGDTVVVPPELDLSYDSTPRNAMTFSRMWVDGVHSAILLLDGRVTDESPVVHVSPMDAPEDVVILAPEFLSYLADGCGTSRERMDALLREGGPGLIDVVRENFDGYQLLDEERVASLWARHGGLVVRGPA